MVPKLRISNAQNQVAPFIASTDQQLLRVKFLQVAVSAPYTVPSPAQVQICAFFIVLKESPRDGLLRVVRTGYIAHMRITMTTAR